MPSRRFRQLSRRIRQLQRHLLPKLSPTGNYNPRQYDRVRSFRLLAHAEIEAFVEDRARDLVNSCVQKWKNDRKPRYLLLSVVAFHLRNSEMSLTRLKAVYSQAPSHTDSCVIQAHQGYNALLTNNHGIREENLLRMLLPLGLDSAEIDSVWLATTDGFGAKRGETAHAAIAAQRPLDPATEMKTVQDILLGLEKLDEKLTKIK